MITKCMLRPTSVGVALVGGVTLQQMADVSAFSGSEFSDSGSSMSDDVTFGIMTTAASTAGAARAVNKSTAAITRSQVNAGFAMDTDEELQQIEMTGGASLTGTSKRCRIHFAKGQTLLKLNIYIANSINIFT